jgi:hypothetical protein
MIRAVDSRGGSTASTGRRAASASPTALVRALAIVFVTVLGAAPALAGKVAAKPAKQRFSFETPLTAFQPSVSDPAKFSFTVPGNSASSARLQTVERAFRFTPSGQSDNRKALSLGVSTKVVAAATERSRAAAPAETLATLPSSYNVDLSVAWQGFAVNTGFSRVEPGPLALLAGGRRDAVDLGISYRGRNWKTSLQGTAEQGSLLMYAPLERRYSVEFGGAYVVAPRLSVKGGIRYKLAPESPSLLDPDRADQSVYFGTNFAF